jgi:glycosyltransferase involved in cell wall biosynthesis
MTHILHIQKVAGIAGSENHLLTLLPALRARGYAVEMLALADKHDRPEAFIANMRAAGVPTRALAIAGDVAPLLVLRLAQFIRAGRYDLVHTHLIHADVYGILAARLAGVRSVVSSRHNDNRFMHYAPLRLLMAAVSRQCDRIICISERLHQFALEVEGATEGQVAVVRYGYDVAGPAARDWRAAYGVPDNAPVVGIVARLIEQKGHTTLLAAMAVAIKRVPTAQLVIIGDGPLRGELEVLAAQLGIAAHVHFLGYQTDAARMMPGFDIFAHPSRWEGFGLVFLEAMAAGVPVVATHVSAIPEIVLHEQTGLLVPPDDPPALAAALERLLTDAALRRTMSLAGRARLASHFTISAMVDRTCAVYAEALAAARPADAMGRERHGSSHLR